MPKHLLLHKELYRKLYLIRRAAQRIKDLYKEDQMKTPIHMSMGEEAIAVGVCESAGKKSQVFGTYRSHAVYLAKADETDKFFAEMYGKVTGATRGKAGSMHLALPSVGVMIASAVVGTNIPAAVGAALANKYVSNSKIALAFFGDGAINEGVFWESLNFACLKRLPVLFVCEDNDLAVHSRVKERSGHRKISEIASKFYCHVDYSETTDVYRIYQITKKMLAKMQKAGMPGFLHFKYYRYLEHVGANEDFDKGYRSREEWLKWLKRDPIKLQRERLMKLGVGEERVAFMEKEIDEKIERSIKKAKKAPFPKLSEAFTDVYAR